MPRIDGSTITVTAAGKNYLKSLPLSKLRKYANAYDVRIDHAIEKEDVIEAVLSARVRNMAPFAGWDAKQD